MAWARTVAVVVPSPATSEVLEATSRTIWAPMFSSESWSSISLATVTPSLVIVGDPNFFSMTTLRPLGPSVTLTASASLLTPWRMRWRASSPYEIVFAAMFFLSPSELFLDDRENLVLSQDQVFLVVDLDFGAGVLADQDAIPLLDVRLETVLRMALPEIAKDRQGFRSLPDRRERAGEIAVRGRVVRVERRRLAKERNRSVELPSPLGDHAEPLVAACELRPETDHLAILRLRLVETPLSAESGREEISKLSVLRLGLHRGARVLDFRVVVPFAVVQVRQHARRPLERRCERERRGELPASRAQVFGLESRFAVVVVPVRAPREEARLVGDLRHLALRRDVAAARSDDRDQQDGDSEIGDGVNRVPHLQGPWRDGLHGNRGRFAVADRERRADLFRSNFPDERVHVEVEEKRGQRDRTDHLHGPVGVRSDQPVPGRIEKIRPDAVEGDEPGEKEDSPAALKKPAIEGAGAGGVAANREVSIDPDHEEVLGSVKEVLDRLSAVPARELVRPDENGKGGEVQKVLVRSRDPLRLPQRDRVGDVGGEEHEADREKRELDPPPRVPGQQIKK